MKVSELQQQLDEGFLDNFVNRVKAMAGGDGPTGIIRALQGNNAAMNKFADALVNVARPQIMRRMGNSAEALRSGTGRMPIGMIYKTTMAMLPKVAANDDIQAEPTAVKQLLKNNKADLLRLVLRGDVADDDVVRRTYDAVLTGAPEADLGNNIDATTKVVALIIASAVMFLETSQQDAEADGVEIDKNLVTEFNKLGIEVTRALASKDSPVIRDLKANDVYKDRVEELIVNIAREVRTKYLNAEPAELDAVISSPPAIVSVQAVKNAIGMHANDLDARTVNTYSQRVAAGLQRLFVAWVKIAKSESTPGRPKSFELMRHWAADFLQNHLDQLDLTATPDGSPPPPPTDEPENTFGKADEAGRAAMAALAQNPGESDSDFNRRQYAEFERARNEYLRAHPLP